MVRQLLSQSWLAMRWLEIGFRIFMAKKTSKVICTWQTAFLFDFTNFAGPKKKMVNDDQTYEQIEFPLY